MSKFKVGDRVFIEWPGSNFHGEDTIVKFSDGSPICERTGAWPTYMFEQRASLTTPNKTLMSSVSSFIKNITRQNPEASFVKAGFLDENEKITTKGREALEYVLWEANKEAVKALADQFIAAEEKK